MGSPTCTTGTRQGNECVTTKPPTCTKGSLRGTKCVTATTDTTAPMNTINHHVAHDCPKTHRYTPPLPLIYFVYTSATPELMTHEQLNEYVKNGGIASSNPGKWKKLDDTHNCYKAVEAKGKTINLLKVIINGVEHAVNAGKIVVNNVEYAVTEAGKVVINGVEHAVDAAGNLIPNWNDILKTAVDVAFTTVDATVQAYKFAGNVLEVVLCAPLVGTAASIAAGVLVSSVTSGNALLGIGTAIFVAAAINDACGNPTVFDQIELAIYLAVGADGRAKVKAFEIYADEEEIDLSLCGPLEGLTLGTLIADIVAGLTSSKWADVADWTFSLSHDGACTLASSPTAAVAAKPNSAASGVPTVSGTARVGETLAAGTSGIADADGLGVFSYQWRADGSPISGATAATYALVAADKGKAISVAVSFTDGGGNAESVASSPTAAVAAKPNSPEPTLEELRAKYLELRASAYRDEAKCGGICWDHPANDPLKAAMNAYLDKLYGRK